MGTGVIVSDEGYIITNNQVIDQANEIEVTLADDRTFDAEVVGTDEKTDIAVLKINAPELLTAELGDSDQIDVGDWVVAMGNPFIWWMGTLFIIFAADRAIRNRDETCIFITATFLFQWLPYALMSRCLFIYHFYINVPLLILAATYFLNESWRDPSRRKYVAAYLIAATVAFTIFYPVISGHPIPNQYRLLLRWFPSWVF